MLRDAKTLSREISQCVADIVDPTAQSFDELKEKLVALQKIVRNFAAAAIQPSLNEKAKQMDGDELQTKQAVARWVSSQLHDLELAIECPQTKTAARIVVIPDSKPHYVLYPSALGRRASVSSKPVFEFELVPAEIHRGALRKYWEKRTDNSDKNSTPPFP